MSIIEETKKKEYINEGINQAKRALEIDNESANSHKWYAICVGARGSFVTTKEKIIDGFDFKDHIELAMKYNPSDFALYHLLGRFEYHPCHRWNERWQVGYLQKFQRHP